MIREKIVKKYILEAFIIVSVFLVSFSALLGIEWVENPKITHNEQGVKKSNLKLISIIKSDFDEDFFLAKPTALAVSQKAIYVYDSMMKSIYMFDHKLKFVKKFMRRGRGPGETNDQGIGFHKLYYRDCKLYACDIYNNKIIVFNENGEHNRDIRFFRKARGYYSFKPVFDDRENLYALSEGKGIVDKYNSNMELVHSYLKPELNEKFMVYRPPFENLDKSVPDWVWKRPNSDDVFYDVIENNRLIIFMARPSVAFIFDGDKLVRKFDVILKLPMESLRREKEGQDNALAKKSKSVFAGHMYDSFVIDADDYKHFYLQANHREKGLILYKFSVDGELVKIISLRNLELGSEILVKKNHLFYGIAFSKGNIDIYKEEESQ